MAYITITQWIKLNQTHLSESGIRLLIVTLVLEEVIPTRLLYFVNTSLLNMFMRTGAACSLTVLGLMRHYSNENGLVFLDMYVFPRQFD